MLMGYFYFLLDLGADKTLQVQPFINYVFILILKLVVIIFFLFSINFFLLFFQENKDIHAYKDIFGEAKTTYIHISYSYIKIAIQMVYIGEKISLRAMRMSIGFDK
jgi:hypothetical protein